MTRAAAPLGVVTRGTTAARRLRRVDRWLLAAHPGLLGRQGLLVVDLGFGATPDTTFELAGRLRARNPSVRVVGLDIDPERVSAARAGAAAVDGVDIAVGGFELAGLRPHLVRAVNVLRQYPAPAVPAAWAEMTGRLSPGGLLLDGTCDETGRLGAWVSLDHRGPVALTLAVDLDRRPSDVAARLPKALIHHNVDGEPIHRLLTALDAAWDRHAPRAVFGPRQRFVAAVAAVRAAGWPVLDGPPRWARGELTLRWSAVAPPAR
jgi:hypothetical protein